VLISSALFHLYTKVEEAKETADWDSMREYLGQIVMLRAARDPSSLFEEHIASVFTELLELVKLPVELYALHDEFPMG